MSKSTTSAVEKKLARFTQPAAIPTMEAIQSLGRTALLAIAVQVHDVGRAAYVTLAKIIVRVEDTLKPGETKFGVLREAGFKDSQIKNGSQLARVWQEFVEPGHMSEAVYDSLGFTDAVNLHAVTAKRGKDFVRSLLAMPDWMDELDHVAEHGQTRLEKKDADAAKAAKEAKALADKAEATAKAAADAAPKPEETAAEMSPSPTPASPNEPKATTGTAAPTPTNAAAKAPESAKVVKAPLPAKDRVQELRKLLAAAETLALDILTSGTPDEAREVAETVEAFAKAVSENAHAVAA